MPRAVAPATMVTTWSSGSMLPRTAGQTFCACVSQPRKLTEGASQRIATVSDSGANNLSYRCAETGGRATCESVNTLPGPGVLCSTCSGFPYSSWLHKGHSIFTGVDSAICHRGAQLPAGRHADYHRAVEAAAAAAGGAHGAALLQGVCPETRARGSHGTAAQSSRAQVAARGQATSRPGEHCYQHRSASSPGRPISNPPPHHPIIPDHRSNHLTTAMIHILGPSNPCCTPHNFLPAYAVCNLPDPAPLYQPTPAAPSAHATAPRTTPLRLSPHLPAPRKRRRVSRSCSTATWPRWPAAWARRTPWRPGTCCAAPGWRAWSGTRQRAARWGRRRLTRGTGGRQPRWVW